MEQLILNIKDKKRLPYIKELIKQIKSVEIVEPKLSAKEKKFLKNLDDSISEVKLHKEGKIKLKSLQDVLNEL